MPKNKQNQAHKPTVAVALSGGVDSAVTALLLKEAGYDLFGIFMSNWEVDPENPTCTIEQDMADARMIADQLHIPFHTVNFRREYWDNVFQHCLDEFIAGRTPNPDVWCNKQVKFKALLDHALSLGASHLATGHYAQIEQQDHGWQLCKGQDPNKDQSYFLYMLNQAQLSKSLFPLGRYMKSDVRAIAQKAGLINYAKKDSTGICFIGERKFKPFLREFLLAQPGDMETPEGKIIGHHDGLMFYTIGQRKGLCIGGQKEADDAPWYVLDKDLKRNVLIVGQGHHHPQLYSQVAICSSWHWVSETTPSLPLTGLAKTRYRQLEKSCELTQMDHDQYQIIFKEPQRAMTPGQSLVFYQNDRCLGGGIINATYR